jgi:hypothetical protein
MKDACKPAKRLQWALMPLVLVLKIQQKQPKHDDGAFFAKRAPKGTPQHTQDCYMWLVL